MRTTVTLPDELVSDLMKYSGASTKTEAVNKAIEAFVRRQRVDRLRALRGKLELQGTAELEDAELEALRDQDPR